ncbi:MAG: ABC transporter ATP-binding protein [Ruthenibacterium sp.]
MATILECNDLVKTYGGHDALRNVTQSFAAGRMIGLLGPNGSGKTTLLKLAAGLLTPTQGTLTVDGDPIGTQTKAVTAYLPDRLCLPKGLRVQESVRFYADFFADFNAEKANEMLTALQIDTHQRLSALSKGTCEKVQLILTMSRAAKLYLLDEPIGGVDPAAREYILNTIIRNYNADACVIIATHLIGDIEKVLDDVVFLQNGSIVLADSVDNVRAAQGKSVDAYFREVFKC